MAYHPLLDWRLSRDMLRLLESKEFDPGAWHKAEGSLAQTFAADFSGTVTELEGQVYGVDLPAPYPLLIVTHPFENTANENVLPARLAFAIGDAEMRGLKRGERSVVFADTFNLVRRPGWVAAEAFQLA